MALTKINKINMNELDLWMTNFVDAMNYNLNQIGIEVPTLSPLLTTIDTAPIQYFKDALDALTESMNESIKEVEERLLKLEQGGK